MKGVLQVLETIQDVCRYDRCVGGIQACIGASEGAAMLWCA
jgi:hypothetical protein